MKDIFSGIFTAVQLGLNIALPLVAGILLGRYLGSRFGYDLIFITLGVLSGLVVGFCRAFRNLELVNGRKPKGGYNRCLRPKSQLREVKMFVAGSNEGNPPGRSRSG